MTEAKKTRRKITKSVSKWNYSLTQDAIDKLNYNVIGKISLDTGCSYRTIEGWINKDYQKGLTRLDVVESISIHTGLSIDQIFIKTEKQELE